MIGQLRGRLADLTAEPDIGGRDGVGYLVAVPFTTYAALGELIAGRLIIPMELRASCRIDRGEVGPPCDSASKMEANGRLGVPTIYLSMGANLGERKGNLRAAIAQLPAAGVQVERVSSLYETEPVDYLVQPWFLNCVVMGETQVPAEELLRRLREIEMRMGSKKEFAKGPRLLDIDILLYGNETIGTVELQVPHPRMLERRFVLAPLAEIAPELTHPAWSNGLTVREALDRSRDSSEVRPFIS
jgi:2-amino-4-hydroxy-6-hydroxymethyldihydropteridine diphosphokinase